MMFYTDNKSFKIFTGTKDAPEEFLELYNEFVALVAVLNDSLFKIVMLFDALLLLFKYC